MAYESDGDAIVKGAFDGIKIGNKIAEVGSWIFFALARPIVLVTQVMLRKDLGERYYTEVQTLLCLLLIWAATWATANGAGLTTARPVYYNAGIPTYGPAPVVPENSAWICGDIWIICFSVATGWNRWVSLRLRRKAGGLWHSRSDGLPRVPQQNLCYELALVGTLAAIAMIEHLWGLGILLALSAILTASAERHARIQLYNHVLDAVDGQIESEWLGKAIEQRLTPAQTQGLTASLPAHVSDEYRKKVAKLFTRPETD